MVDMQRERLRHLVSNAILELWKKETGSLSSVLIEGTICITSGSGRTTVVQVHDKFSGPIPECGEESGDNLGRSGNTNTFFGSPNGVSRSSKYAGPPSVDCKPHNAAAMQAYLDELSPASLVSPTSETPMTNNDNNNNAENSSTGGNNLHKSSGMDSGIDVNTTDNERTSVEFSINQLKDEFLSDEEEDSLNSSKSSAAGPVCPGTGYYTTEGKEGKELGKEPNNNKRRSSSIEKPDKDVSGIDADFSISDGPGPLMSTPKPPKHSKMSFNISPSSSLNGSLNGGNALDLSKRDSDDLALSSPQNYTAQVRDVIRQRLLAHKGSLSISDDAQLDKDLEDLKNSEMIKREDSPARSKSLSELNSLPHFSSSSLQHATSLLRSPHHASLLSPFPFPLFPGSSKGRPPMAPSPHSLHEAMANSLKHHMPALIPLPVSVPERASSAEPVNLAQDPVENRSTSTSPGNNSGNDKETNGEQKVYKCDFCSKTFLFKSKYHEHLPVHTNARPFQCRLCSRTYKYKYDLRVHLRTHMGIPTKSTVCPFCNAKFDTNKLLRLHIKDAHRERHRVTEEDCAQLYEGVL